MDINPSNQTVLDVVLLKPSQGVQNVLDHKRPSSLEEVGPIAAAPVWGFFPCSKTFSGS